MKIMGFKNHQPSNSEWFKIMVPFPRCQSPASHSFLLLLSLENMPFYVKFKYCVIGYNNTNPFHNSLLKSTSFVFKMTGMNKRFAFLTP